MTYENGVITVGAMAIIAVLIINKKENMPAAKKKTAVVPTPSAVQQVETTKAVAGTTVFSFTKPTPMWATWIFRTEFILNKALLFWLSGTAFIPPSKVKEYVLILGAVDLVVWFLARSVGIKKDDIEKELS